MVVAGEFSVGSYLTTDQGLTSAGPITGVSAVGQYLLYDASKASADIINTIFVPNTYTAAEGNTRYGWALTPTHRQKEVLYGDTYIYSVDAGAWILQYTPEEDDLLNDGRYVYRLRAAEDWYKNQIAFQGVPWYRFAPRPTATLDALDRGASGDGLNIIIYDETGALTGSKGNVLESFYGVSKFKGAETPEGENNYYVDVINSRSNYLFANRPLDDTPQGKLLPIHLLLNSGLDAAGDQIGDGKRGAYIAVESLRLGGGVDNFNVTLGELQAGYDKFDKENVEDLDYILQGPGLGDVAGSVAKANFIISIVESRRDCMAFLSPPRSLVVNQSDSERITDSIIDQWANEIASSSYTVLDSGYKYTYDRFADAYRYVPLNGDVAGTLVFSSIVAEAWYSPAGMSRGQIRNVVKMPYDPSKAQRDQLYAARVNPVVTFPGEGTILYGDKTALAYSSAFDRINVRKLFLVIEKAIAKSARTALFEFNDEITRSLFKNNVNPFLRDVQSRRGMYDFLVVCDESNNPPEIIDRNEFVADIYIKPAKSINFITLNFVATKTGVNFDESVALFRGANGSTNR